MLGTQSMRGWEEEQGQDVGRGAEQEAGGDDMTCGGIQPVREMGGSDTKLGGIPSFG